MTFVATLALLLQDVEVDARVRAWRPAIAGGVKGDLDNGTISLDDDLDLDSPLGMALFDLRLRFGSPGAPAVGISGASFATSGETRLDSNETFEGGLFPAGAILRSRFRFETFGVDVHVGGREDPEEPFRFRFSVGLHYLEAEVSLSSPGAHESEEYSDANLKFSFGGEFLPAPWAFLGGSIAVYTDVVSLLFGLDSGHYAGEFEALGGVEVGPFRLELGFRVFAWTLNWTDSQVDLVGYGPFAGLTLGF